MTALRDKFFQWPGTSTKKIDVLTYRVEEIKELNGLSIEVLELLKPFDDLAFLQIFIYNILFTFLKWFLK